jgi:hypothetical protein
VLNGFKTDTVQMRDLNAVNANVDINGGTTQANVPGDAADLASSGTLVSLSFANKTHVVVNGQGDNDFFLVTVGLPADGLQTLTLDEWLGKRAADIGPERSGSGLPGVQRIPHRHGQRVL